MIRTLHVRNFKSLRHVKVDLERFTVFVGANGSGKTSVLQALDFVCRAFGALGAAVAVAQQDAEIDKEFQQSASRNAPGPVDVIANADGVWYRYRARKVLMLGGLGQNLNPGWTGEGLGTARSPDGDWEPWKQRNVLGGGPLPRSALLRLESSKLSETNPPPDAATMMPDGLGLHSALANMALNDPDAWRQLQTDLQRIVPSIRRIRHNRIGQQAPLTLLFDMTEADSLPASQVSEGTLLVLGLLAALHAQFRPSLFLLDDIDRGLHPKAQKELVLLLRGLLDTNPDLQIIATTHSPFLLDCLEPGEVRMITLENGSSTCAPLAAHPKFPKWKDEMAPGEMWSLFGDEWVAESVGT